jgi:hypothetical protein
MGAFVEDPSSRTFPHFLLAITGFQCRFGPKFVLMQPEDRCAQTTVNAQHVRHQLVHRQRSGGHMMQTWLFCSQCHVDAFPI